MTNAGGVVAIPKARIWKPARDAAVAVRASSRSRVRMGIEVDRKAIVLRIAHEYNMKYMLNDKLLVANMYISDDLG